MLLDYELARAGIDPDAIIGYAREEPTHLAVAAAIAADRADCGMGVLAAARAFGLDFVPVTQRAVRPRARARVARAPAARAVLASCSHPPEFQAAVEQLGGYDTAEMGRRIR